MTGFEASLDRTRLERLRHGSVVVSEEAAVFEVTGPQALDCMQGLLTNDLIKPGDESVVYGALLTPKGMIVVDYWVLRHAGALTMIAPARARDTSAGLFTRQLPPRLAKARDRTGDWSVAWLHGSGAGAAVLAAGLSPELPAAGKLVEGRSGQHAILVVRPGPAAPFAFSLTGPALALEAAVDDLVRAGAVRGDGADRLAARVIAGWPALEAEIDDKTLPQEVRYDEIDGVSYTKGCYTGQETVARVHFRGHPNRELRGILWPSAEPVRGRDVTVEDSQEGDAEPADEPRRAPPANRLVGTVRTVLHLPDRALGLAVIRREIPPGRAVTAGGRAAEVVPLPFGEEHLPG
jgi:folate-binding protein YgfZ